MTTLYEITNQFNDALSFLADSDLDDQTIKDTLEGLEGELEDKFEAVAMYQQNLIEAAELKKQRAKELSDQSKAMAAKAESLYQYIDTNMRKLEKELIKCKFFDLKYRKCPDSVNIIDESKVPSDLVKTKVVNSVDKREALARLKDGDDLDGLELITGKKKLVIK